MRTLRRYRKGIIGLVLVAIVVFTAVLAPWLAPHDPVRQDLAAGLRPPAFMVGGVLSHPLGTDSLGRDLLSRMMYGGRVSLLVGFFSVLVSGAFGVLVGLLAGFYGGPVDSLLNRLIDIQMSVPFLVLAVALMAVIKPSMTIIVLLLGISGWASYARVVRGQVLALREREFVEATTALGASVTHILWVHILPNIRNTVIVIATLEVGKMILAEASLSYLGIGVQPPLTSWGVMIADGKDYLSTAWWIATFPGLAITLTVLGINNFGDWLRDISDPRARGSG